MKRKLPLLLVMLMLLSMVYLPAASAMLSPQRNDNEIDIDDDDVPLIELPTAEVVAEVIVDKSGTADVKVEAAKLLEAVESVVSGDAVQIVVAATAASNPANDGTAVSAVKAVMPKEALKAVAEQTDVEVAVVTDVGQMTLPHAALASIVGKAGDEDVTFTMSKKSVDTGKELLQEVLGSAMDIPEDRIQGGSITEVDILSGGENITSWDGGAVTLELPIGAGEFEQDKGYRVIQISADKSETEHIGRCVADDMGLHVEISITHLSTFVVLAGAVEEDMGPESVPMVQSPLAVTPNTGSDNSSSSGGGSGSMLCVWVGLALVAVAAGSVMLKRRQSSKANK